MSSIEIINKFVKKDDNFLGYEIHTSEQVISCLIDNCSNCCENWGFLTTEDTLDDFVGSELLSISLVDMEYNQHPLVIKSLEDDPCFTKEETAFCFIDINTSVGKLQFAIYNSHNGYYGHSVNITSKQLTHECYL